MTNRDAKISSIQTALADARAKHYELSKEIYINLQNIKSYEETLKKYGAMPV